MSSRHQARTSERRQCFHSTLRRGLETSATLVRADLGTDEQADRADEDPRGERYQVHFDAPFGRKLPHGYPMAARDGNDLDCSSGQERLGGVVR